MNYNYVLTGFAGGSHYKSAAGGANHLCLRSDPVFRPTDESRVGLRAEVLGAEYGTPPKSLLHYHDVPCAVCVVTRKLVLMMPGTNLCDEGWTTEYVGYIAAARIAEDRHRSEFICIDEDVEPTTNSGTDLEGGAILYPAQTVCGSLPCLPYVDSKDLLCVVCSR